MDDAELSSATALQGPEKVLVRAGIGDAYRTVSRNNLGFQQARSGNAVALGITPKAPSEHEPGDADGGAAPALNITAVTRRHLIIDA